MATRGGPAQWTNVQGQTPTDKEPVYNFQWDLSDQFRTHQTREEAEDAYRQQYQADDAAWHQKWEVQAPSFNNPNAGGANIGFQVDPKATQAPTPAGPPSTTSSGDAIKYDANGYAQQIAAPNFGPDPYLQQMSGDQNQVNQGTQNAQNNIQNLNNQYAQASGQGSAYPAMPNSFGLGQSMPSPNGPDSPISAKASSYNANPITQPGAPAGSGGFNPWSLQGESNARGD